jgi:hypothetical protein
MPIFKTNTTQSHTQHPRSSRHWPQSSPRVSDKSSRPSPLTAGLYEAHEAAASHSDEVLRLQSALSSHHATQKDLARDEAEEASWSVLSTTVRLALVARSSAARVAWKRESAVARASTSRAYASAPPPGAGAEQCGLHVFFEKMCEFQA